MNKSHWVLMSGLAALGLALAACQGERATPTDTATPGPTVTPTVTPEPTATPEPVPIRWLVGLGAGGDEPTFAGQQAVVDRFNASQNRIKLVLEIYD